MVALTSLDEELKLHEPVSLPDGNWKKYFPYLQPSKLISVLSNGLGLNFKYQALKSGTLKDSSLYMVCLEASGRSYDSFLYIYEDLKEENIPKIKKIEFLLIPEISTAVIKKFSVSQQAQGNGKFSQMLYNITQLAPGLGLDKICNNQTINFSLKTQSRMGFLPDPLLKNPMGKTWEENVRILQKRFNNLISENCILFNNESEKYLLSSLINNLEDNPRNLWIIGGFKNKLHDNAPLLEQEIREGFEIELKKKMDLGTYLKFNLHVTGYYDLKDKEVKSLMNRYFDKKQISKIRGV